MPNIAPGINIFTGNQAEAGLGAALTNPTVLSLKKGSIERSYPVLFGSLTYADAETCFQATKTRRLSVPAPEVDLVLLQVIIAHKLLQHEGLYEAITERGGVAWLQRCWHKTGAKTDAYQWWEGEGVSSPMICCLIEGYKLAQQALAVRRQLTGRG